MYHQLFFGALNSIWDEEDFSLELIRVGVRDDWDLSGKVDSGELFYESGID